MVEEFLDKNGKQIEEGLYFTWSLDPLSPYSYVSKDKTGKWTYENALGDKEDVDEDFLRNSKQASINLDLDIHIQSHENEVKFLRQKLEKMAETSEEVKTVLNNPELMP